MAEFIKQGNAICVKAEKTKGEVLAAAAKLVKPGTKLSQSQQNKLVVDVALPPYKKMTQELGALETPQGEEAQVDAIVSEFEASIKEVEADPTTGAATNATLAKANKLAAGFGLTSCRI
jgi:hypothetical protein